MEHWEFLLQKEGDRSWLPLDSPDVEILEGRYRIVARSSHVNAAIETRIVHIATEAVPPTRRVQKRLCQTNQEGLTVVIPFTRLEPGLWELQCSPKDLLTDLMAGAQTHAVTLQVVAHDVEEDWDPDWTSPAALTTVTMPSAVGDAKATTGNVAAENVPAASTDLTDDALMEQAIASSLQSESAINPLPATNDRQVPLPPEVSEILGASMERLFQIAEQLSEQLVDDVLQDFDLATLTSTSSSIDVASPVEPAHAGESTLYNGEDFTTPVSNSAATWTNGSVPPSQPDDVASQSLPTYTPTLYTLAAGEAFSLTLDESTFVATRGEEITVSGQVAIVPQSTIQLSPAKTRSSVPVAEPDDLAAVVDPWASEASPTFAGATAQVLQLCLRDPQSLQVLVSDHQMLPSASYPLPFTFTFSLPDTFATHLVLGEVLLCGALPDQPEASIVLLTQAFSITVDPTALVGELAKLHEALTTEIDDEERIDLPLELSSRLKEQASPPLDLSFLDLAVIEPTDERSPRFPSLAGQPLPPQLYRPTPEQANARPLDLPAFKLANQPSEPQAPMAETITPIPSTSDASVTAAETNAVDVPETAPILADDHTEATPEALDSAKNDALPAEEASIEALDRADINSTDKTLDLPSPTHMAFQSLKLQDRFLTRLTSLASDTELSALLKANLAPGSLPPNAITVPAVAEARSLTDEIVVDDEPLPNERRRSNPQPTMPPMQPTTDQQPNPLILPAEESVPTPTLEVVTGELVSGKPINIRVKLPNLLPRIYVKLWVTDRQTRSLLDAPRWLIDFLPNGLGDLEAMTPLTVPFGSVEIRLEAIAVEMHTQRESHKVTVDRLVVPPDLPSVSLEDFNE
ncbi:hypothetical protein H6F76_29345 [Leptolyngbya sp. FACHB-321]|uniref:hypothetical protein n=1 Tax=Leptolyngbya sp. FACHB-321 TaxID=2692807 RepID=UPI001682DD7F|nr:hypothetical protein [Leptolyngbya sp. FACHB-321]MBD2039061.1 hypothetical protein [Leptolyngbya sp. FACHB-321]